MFSLIQLIHEQRGRAVAVVEGDSLGLLRTHQSTYALAAAAMRIGDSLINTAEGDRSGETLDYDPIYEGRGDWAVLPALDHPDDPARCNVAGTGLTHLGSAKSRQAMHAADANASDEPITDSMRMFQMGVEGGKPAPGCIGVQPEWFYKGDGAVLRGHGQSLEVPPFADDGGEEPEVVGLYVIDNDQRPRRVGMAIGNEFADHVMEKQNYLYLAPSKVRHCSVGPELIVEADFDDVAGRVSIERDDQIVWEKSVATGEANMSHTVANLEHHHFKYDAHRRPGDVHVHFFGADAFSFGSGVSLEDGDIMVIAWAGFGRPLRNPIRIDRSPEPLMAATPL